jgi:hypothetical protein
MPGTRPARVPLPFKYRLAHYGGLAGARAKIEALLSRLPWEPITDYLARAEAGRA